MSTFQRAFIFLILLSVQHIIWAQDIYKKEIKISPGVYSLHQVLQTIRKNGVNIAFSANKLPDKQVLIQQSPIPLSRLLEALRTQTGISFENTRQVIAIGYGATPIKKRTHTVRGVVRDKESGELLIGATLYMTESQSGTVTNNYGYFSLTLPAKKHVIRVSFVGYHSLLDTLNLSDYDQSVTILLTSDVGELNEVIVSGLEPDFNISSMVPGYNTINLSTEGQIPYFLGEVDVLQGARLLPGIKTLGEDANGLNIRGGSTDQNLILLDEATVYNPNHLYGLISIFNPEAVNHVEIMKGFIPPSYGGRASSVITVHQKEGDYNNYHFTGGVGLVSAKFIAEGPIKKKESSFILSGRQSLLNLQLEDDSKTNFQDLNTKINWKMNDKNTFYLSGYFGNDRSSNTFSTVRNWGNRNTVFRWNHMYGKRTFSNISAIISDYNYKITQPQEAASYIGKSKIIDYTLKGDWGFTMNPKNEIQFGFSSILHRLKPGDRIPYSPTSSSNPLHLNPEHGLESAIYASHEAKINSHLTVLYGLRLSSLLNIGSSEIFDYAANKPRTDESITDTTNYKKGQLVKSYLGKEPRLSINYQFNAQSSIKASFTRSYQYLHLISSTITPSPTDIWKLSGTYVKPTSSNHYSLGYYHNMADNNWEMYVDTYYKSIQNIVEYKNGANLLFKPNPETELLNGQGRAYGVEFFIKKNKGRFTGWISYTLSRSEIKVDSKFASETINGGNYFPSNYDKTHDISVVGIYKILPRLSGSFSFNFNTGRPFTLPLGKYDYGGNQIPLFGYRNQNRLPDYHRLDISLKWYGKTHKSDGSPKKYQDYWTLVVYNVYARKNVYSYLFEKNSETGVTTIVPYSIFRTAIPGITYNFKF